MQRRRWGKHGELDTWTRDLHAKLVERLSAAGASAIAFDLIFDEQRDATKDTQFADAIGAAGNVILVERTEVEPVRGRERRDRTTLPAAAGVQDTCAGARRRSCCRRVPVRVGQFWTFGRASTDTASLPVVMLQAHLLPLYERVAAHLESAAPGTTAALPQTRVTYLRGDVRSKRRSARCGARS